MNLLIQFLLRLSFGLAAGMAITSSKKVTSGYFRNHLYVTLGLTTLAAVVSFYLPEGPILVTRDKATWNLQSSVFWFSLAGAVLSYIGSITWLYEKHVLGKLFLVLLAVCCLNSATAQNGANHLDAFRNSAVMNRYVELQGGLLDTIWAKLVYLQASSVITSGLLLGMTMAAMLLGHWYLNTPTMELVPLRRLIIAMGAAVVLQAIVSALGLWGELTYANQITTQWWLFLLLRWLFGIVGVGILAIMAWQTLKIPNTQSATGILYVAVIGTFVGETMALLLSAESLFPL